MEARATQTRIRQTDITHTNIDSEGDKLAQKRLNALLAINSEIAREKSLFNSERERTEAALMSHPMSYEKSFAFFGLLLGIFPPAAVFVRFFIEKGNFRSEDFWIFGILAIINLISATVGYFSGKVIGKIISELEKTSWSMMIITLPFIGLLWGILAGGAGGVIVFVFGAIFGAMLGGAVGSVALPAFAIFHRLLKKGDQFDRRHFLPVAFGITFIISAFILGL